MNVLGISAKLQGGKSSSAKFLIGLALVRLNIVRGSFKMTESGDIHVTDIMGDVSYDGIFDPFRRNDSMIKFLQEYVDPFVKVYSFADKLKAICIDILGLDEEACYGTNEQKNAPTNIKWEDFFGVLVPEQCGFLFNETSNGFNEVDEIIPQISDTDFQKGNWSGSLYWNGIAIHKSGYMTGREVMEFLGTMVFRNIKEDCWISSVIKQIKKDQPMLAVIQDVRSLNECFSIKEIGGKTLRLGRNPYPNPDSVIENQLDSYPDFDALVDNSQMTLDEKNEKVIEILSTWEYIDSMEFNS